MESPRIACTPSLVRDRVCMVTMKAATTTMASPKRRSAVMWICVSVHAKQTAVSASSISSRANDITFIASSSGST